MYIYIYIYIYYLDSNIFNYFVDHLPIESIPTILAVRNAEDIQSIQLDKLPAASLRSVNGINSKIR